VFGLILLQSAWQAARPNRLKDSTAPYDPLGEPLKLNGPYTNGGAKESYAVHRVKTGFGSMFRRRRDLRLAGNQSIGAFFGLSSRNAPLFRGTRR
jgi:hypothetical protein